MAKSNLKKLFKLCLGLWREVADTVTGSADVIDELREEMNSRFDQVDKRLDNVEGRLDTLDVGQTCVKD